ncbi:hypothetical protein GYH30_025793 [Glycine max]|uniref:Uncharacterized protein n=1 Tax=Glycine max TaxID=3847 RepID=A0A0R0IHL3_SOYBN|nr:hypothetical protein GYH30_025793 [Glycine max]
MQLDCDNYHALRLGIQILVKFRTTLMWDKDTLIVVNVRSPRPALQPSSPSTLHMGHFCSHFQGCCYSFLL